MTFSFPKAAGNSAIDSHDRKQLSSQICLWARFSNELLACVFTSLISLGETPTKSRLLLPDVSISPGCGNIGEAVVGKLAGLGEKVYGELIL